MTKRKENKADGAAARRDEQAHTTRPQLASAVTFARLLEWRLELYFDDELVMIQLVHTSHMKGAAVLGGGQHPLTEQFTEDQPSFVVSLRRSLFRDEGQIREWFASICEAFDLNLHGVLAFEIQHHFHDLARFQLDLDGILVADKSEIIKDHIEGQADEPSDIGTREFLRILLAARGPGNKSPANEFNLPGLIRTALRNLRPSRLHTYQGVNDYLKTHSPGYASADGESFRKLCKRCGVDFVGLVREERERRKAEN